MARLKIRSSLVLAAFVAALGITACGDSGGNPQQVVKDTFSGSKKVNSANIAFALDLVPQGGSSQPVSIKLSGPFESQGPGKLPKLDLKISIDAKGQNKSFGVTSTGTDAFVTVNGQAYSLPPGTLDKINQRLQSNQQNGNKGGIQGFKSLGVNPANWLKNEKSQGSADVGGTSTDHVSADIDVPKLITDVLGIAGKLRAMGVNTPSSVPTAIPPATLQKIQSAIQKATVDVYSGKSDRILRRFSLNLVVQAPAGTSTSSSSAKGATVTFDIQLTGVNQPQTINAPANPKPFTDLQGLSGGSSGLGGLLSGGSTTSSGTSSFGATDTTGATSSSGTDTTGSSSGSTQSTGSGPSSAATSAYLQCIQAAGGNSAKATKCLSLLK